MFLCFLDEDTVRIPMNPERPMWPFTGEENTGGRPEPSEDTTDYGRPKKKGKEVDWIMH